jgi:hypothetical protein
MATLTTLKLLTVTKENLNKNIYYFTISTNHFAIEKNNLYFFDDKFKINFDVNIKSSNKNLIKSTFIQNAIEAKIINKSGTKNINLNSTNPISSVDFKNLQEIKKDTEIEYNSKKDKITDIVYDFIDDKLLLELKEEGLVDYDKSKIELINTKNNLKIDDLVIHNSKTNEIYKIESIAGKYANISKLNATGKKKVFFSKLTKYDPNKTITTKVVKEPITTKPSDITPGFIFGIKNYQKHARVIYKKGKPDKIYTIDRVLPNGTFIIHEKNNKGIIIEKNIIAKKNDIESASVIKKGDKVVLNKKDLFGSTTGTTPKYYTVKSISGNFVNIVNDKFNEQTKRMNQLYKVSNSKHNKLTITKPKIYGKPEIDIGTRVIYEKGKPDKIYTVKSIMNDEAVILEAEDSTASKNHIVAKIIDIESASIIKKGNIVALKKNDFFNKNKHHTVESVGKSTANVVNSSKIKSTVLLKNLYKVSNSKNEKSKNSFSFSGIFSSKGIKKGDQVVYKHKIYTVMDVPSKFPYSKSDYMLKDSNGTIKQVSKKDFENDQKKEPEKRGSKGRT